MKKTGIIFAGMLTAVAAVGMSHPADAAGCLKGAVVGGVAGHFAGHHGLLGAGIGCAIGHHHATVRERERRDYDHRY